MKKITLAITGASGIPFATKLLQELLNSNCKVNLVISQAGVLTSNQEMHFNLPTAPHKIHEILVDELQLANSNNLTVYAVKDWFAPIASGSSVDDVMIICPCSMATLAKVAGGIGDDLICRAADVILKERKNLIIVPRETPLSSIHLANMLKLSDLGVSIIPPVPAFYTLPKTLDDVINFIVSRIMDQAGVNNDLTKRW
jgi:4-hydroxy-3-polyprenylbenzoate decarboxylase